MKQKDKDTLGFVFGYKETNKDKVLPNVFTVKNISGISDLYPSVFKNKKDFWVEEITEGQVSELFINKDMFKEAYLEELSLSMLDESEFVKDEFQKRKYYFSYPITEEQFVKLNSFSMAHLHVHSYQTWENESVLSQILKETIGDAFKNDARSILEIYQDFKAVSTFIYEKEVGEALGSFSGKNKLKM